ncbi:hypothetical protein AKJ08_0235 [Vulgatibacter incomptus]|uniref:O-antigen ligase-related domain-containing protein n=2 Tax=Vulgatibacter incomptus TaxID=1391653 RepID=A0A0K1P8J0_9BACT|nr:hypothetical protein AKJ08_0235 [Vulgatibacter incomptus]
MPVVVAVVTTLATVGGVVASGGDPIAAIAPTLVVALVYVITRIPLRWSATTLVLLLIAIDIPSDAGGLWSSPFIFVGDLLHDGFSRLAHVPFSGFEAIVALLMILAAWRHATSSDIDGGESVRTASVMRDGILVFLAGCAYAVAMGFMKGHGLALWKIRYLLQVPMFFVFFQTAFRRPEDFRPLAVVVVLAAQIKALMAVWIQLVVAPALTGGRLEYATNHGDSVTFAMAVMILLIPLMVERTKRSVTRALLLLPLPLWGMLLNSRRLVWAMLAMAIGVIFLGTSWRPWKSRIVKTALILSPLIVAYLAVGWRNAEASGIFTPIAKIHTMLDSNVDRSTLWREREDWNIAESIKQNSFLGAGLSGQYVEYIFNDDITSLYADYKAWPHNTVLGMLLLAGVPGFAALWLPFLLTVFLAVRAERRARSGDDRILAMVSLAAIVAVLSMAWGDTGAHFIQYKVAMGLTMALVAKLAVATGAWPSTSASKA